MTNKGEERINKIREWFSDRNNLILFGILVFAFIIRVYFFIKTSGQTLWWDESEYMAKANEVAFGVPYDENPQRPPLFQFLAGLFFLLGLGENFIKFSLVVIPSVFLVFTIYLLGREMFNEKIGLISAFLASVSWTFVFWSARVQPDFASMSFSVLSTFFMWKYWKNPAVKLIVLSGVTAALGFYFKVSALLVPMIFFVFIFLKDRFSALKNRDYWYFAAAFLLTLLPYFVWSYIVFSTPFGFTAGYIEPVPQETPFGWYNIDFYSKLTTNGLGFSSTLALINPSNFKLLPNFILLFLFITGVILSLRFIFYLDILAKEKEKCFNSDLFSILALVFISAFYIFHIKNTDDRWVFLWLPFIFFVAGNACLFVYEKLKKYGKVISLFVVFILLLLAGYSQLSHASSLIEIKKDSYLPVKLAGEWIKENSDKEDILMSISSTQSTYYSQREVIQYAEMSSKEEFDKFVEKNKPRFLQVSVFEPHPQWIFEWTEKNKDKIQVVQAYFADKEQKQAVLVIYRLK